MRLYFCFRRNLFLQKRRRNTTIFLKKYKMVLLKWLFGAKNLKKLPFFCQKNATLGSKLPLTKKNGNFVSALMILFLYSKKSRTYLVRYNLVRAKFGALICHLKPSYSSVNSTNIIIRVAQCNERWSATDSNLNSI